MALKSRLPFVAFCIAYAEPQFTVRPWFQVLNSYQEQSACPGYAAELVIYKKKNLRFVTSTWCINFGGNKILPEFFDNFPNHNFVAFYRDATLNLCHFRHENLMTIEKKVSTRFKYLCFLLMTIFYTYCSATKQYFFFSILRPCRLSVICCCQITVI